MLLYTNTYIHMDAGTVLTTTSMPHTRFLSLTHTHTNTYVHTYIHTYTHTHIHTYILTCVHTYIHTYIYIYIYIYIYACRDSAAICILLLQI